MFFDAKRLLAQTINSPKVQEFIPTWPFSVVGDPDPEEGKVHFLSVHGEQKIFIPPENVSGDILKSLLGTVCRRLNITASDIEAVITVPAYFSMAQKRATMKAAKIAGFNVKQLLSEPVAAALAYQMELEGDDKLKEGDSVFIFDLGGGTFDVTVMRIEKGMYKVIAVGGDTHLGGRDFDEVIVKIIQERLKKQLGENRFNELLYQPKYRYRIRKAASSVKESLSQTESEIVMLSDIYPDAQNEKITRVEFEQESQYLIKKIRECCEKTLHNAKLDPKDIDHTIPVGGASRMNMIQNTITSIFRTGTNISKTISGDEAIAKGATIYAAKLLNISESDAIKNLKIQDALPLSIGVEVAGNKFKPVLKNNSQIPTSSTIELKTSKDNQRTATIPVCFNNIIIMIKLLSDLRRTR